jgi:acyl-CoA thioesterase I
MLGVLIAVLSATAAVAQPIKIVAFGGSSTYSQGVERYDAYPAKLEKALRAKGYNVVVTNACMSGDKTADGLRRLDRAVPADSQIVIVEYGINDHFAKNDPQLRTTGVAHYNAAGYDMIVARILPEVEALIARVRR